MTTMTTIMGRKKNNEEEKEEGNKAEGEMMKTSLP
jgi:hypothetical protein